MNENQHRINLKSSGKRWVVKIGSALLTAGGKGLDYYSINTWVSQINQLIERGIDVLLVSSGAIAEGMTRMGLKQRPEHLHDLQAAAAIGQMGLIQAYESAFRKFGKLTAQILLTHDDLADRQRYLNAKSTLSSLLSLGTIPIINENDTVTTTEIKFGDNDSLAALVANLVQADCLLILTNQDGMYESDPQENSKAKMLTKVYASDTQLAAMATGSKDGLGRGGMITKVRSAKLAARSGAYTVIANGMTQNILLRIADGEPLGTLFIPDVDSHSARKQWIAGHLKMKGSLLLDDGAVRVLKSNGSSLLAVGVRDVIGEFIRGEMVACINQTGQVIAHGLVNYSAREITEIKGKSSGKIKDILGYINGEEVINRDNLVVID